MPEVDDDLTEIENQQADNQAKAFDRIAKERDALREKVAAYEKAEATRRRAEAFKELQVDSKYADLYSGEDTPEAIKEWAEKYGFVGKTEEPASEPKPAEQAPQPTEPIPSSGMQPVVGGSQPFAQKLTAAQYAKLAIEKPEEAKKAWVEGRVDLLRGGTFTGGSVTSTPFDESKKQE